MSKENSSVSGWLDQLLAGDKGFPVQKLWERYFHRLVELARRKLRNMPCPGADEEDVALNAFNCFCQAALRGNYPNLHDRDDLWKLLVTITANEAYQVKLKNGRRKRGGNGTAVQDAPLENGQIAIGMEQFLSQEPTADFVAQAIEEFNGLMTLLPSSDLRRIAQWKMEGFTNDEIAERLHCVARTVERKLGIIRTCWEHEQNKNW